MTRHVLGTAIQRQRDHVLALERAVDGARCDVDRAVDDLRAAVRERERADEHLRHLEEWEREVFDAA